MFCSEVCVFLFVYGIKIVFHVPFDRHMKRVECVCVKEMFALVAGQMCNVRPALRTSVLAVRDDPEGLRFCKNEINIMLMW